MMQKEKLREFLDLKVAEFNNSRFIEQDPISIPHLFSHKQDIEIAGFFAAIFAWGNRTTIINKSKVLLDAMDMSPHDFCLNASPRELKKLHGFRHRTFFDDDLFYFLHFLRQHYRNNDSLETAFSRGMGQNDKTVEHALNGFREYFLSMDHLKRTEKHVAHPAHGSTCKRLNMFLRWMVRIDGHGVDFGIWQSVHPSQLVCPVDVHVARTARSLGLLKRKQTDWMAAEELTEQLRRLDAADPVKYDFALFGVGVSSNGRMHRSGRLKKGTVKARQ